MGEKLNQLALGYSIGILSVISIILLWVLGKARVAAEAVRIMEAYHVLFSLSILGLIGGIIEAGIFGFATGYLTAYIYNKFV